MILDFKASVIEAAKFMAVSARTAPKTRGLDDVEIALLSDEGDLQKLADEMKKIGEETDRGFFIRDSDSVRRSQAVLLIGVKASNPKDLNCGGCGYESCEDFKKALGRGGRDLTGPSCAFQLIDLGIAVGSAAKTASILNVDNRVMFSIGVAALKLGFLKNSDVALGLPLSAYGKNIYFDRKK